MKQVRTMCGAVAAALLLIAGIGCSSSQSLPEIAAVVEGANVPSTDVEAMTARYVDAGTEAPDRPPLPIAEARRAVLDFLIRFTLLRQLAKEMDIPLVPTEAIDAALSTLNPEDYGSGSIEAADVRQSVEAGELSKRIGAKQFPSVAVSDYEVSQVYEKVKDVYKAGWLAEVRVAYFAKQEKAEEFIAKAPSLDQFDSVAIALGAGKVGSMGSVSNSDALGQDVLDTLADLSPLQLSKVVKSTGGFLVFIIEKRTNTPGKTVDEAYGELLAKLQDNKRKALFEKWFDEQVNKADITVDQFYGKWNPERGYTVG